MEVPSVVIPNRLMSAVESLRVSKMFEPFDRIFPKIWYASTQISPLVIHRNPHRQQQENKNSRCFWIYVQE